MSCWLVHAQTGLSPQPSHCETLVTLVTPGTSWLLANSEGMLGSPVFLHFFPQSEESLTSFPKGTERPKFCEEAQLKEDRSACLLANPTDYGLVFIRYWVLLTARSWQQGLALSEFFRCPNRHQTERILGLMSQSYHGGVPFCSRPRTIHQESKKKMTQHLVGVTYL